MAQNNENSFFDTYVKPSYNAATAVVNPGGTLIANYPEVAVGIAQRLDPDKTITDDTKKEYYSKYFNRAAPYGLLSTTQPTGVDPNTQYTQPTPESTTTPNTNVTKDPATPFQVLSSNPNQPTEGLSPTSADPQKGILSQQQTNQTGIVSDTSISRLQGQVGNRMAGVGDGFGNLEPAPQPPIKQSYAEQMQTVGDRVAMDQNKIPNWHESDSFNYALINFGLNLLSGNDLANSFSNASTTFIDMFGREKRGIWAEDLRKQGYDETEIQRYIETGDNKVLTNPFEKKARMMDYNLKAAQLDQALYENDPKTRQYKINRQNWEDRIKLTEIQDRREQAAADLALRREEVKMRRQEAAERRADKLEASRGLSSRDLSQLQTASRDSIRNLQQKYTNSQLAHKALSDLEAAVKRGDNDTAQGQYLAFREYQARAMLGGGATLTPKQLEETTGLPDKLDNALQKGLMGFGGISTDKWINVQKAVTDRAIENEKAIVYDKAESLYQALYPQYGHEVASNAANRIMSGSGMGYFNFDPTSQSVIRKTEKADEKSVKIIRE